MRTRITSTANPHIKAVLSLQKKASQRRKNSLFVIEGFRELSRAVSAGYQIRTLFLCADFLNQGIHEDDFLKQISPQEIFDIAPNVFSKLAYRDTTDGLIAVAEAKEIHPENLKCGMDSIYIVLESVEKPGNLGAVLRTADAAGVSGVIVCEPRADIYNPNTIRASLGCVFTVPVVTCTSEQAMEWMKKNNIRMIAAAPDSEKLYYETDLTGKVALIMGAEADGLTEFWLKKADEKIRIPMYGKADSLNVSVSAAIIIYEALRQRAAKK